MNARDYAEAHIVLRGERSRWRRVHGESKAMAFVLMHLGILAMFQRDYQRAIGLFEESLALYRATAGSLPFSGILLYFLSRTRFRKGELARRGSCIEELPALVSNSTLEVGRPLSSST